MKKCGHILFYGRTTAFFWRSEEPTKTQSGYHVSTLRIEHEKADEQLIIKYNSWYKVKMNKTSISLLLLTNNININHNKLLYTFLYSINTKISIHFFNKCTYFLASKSSSISSSIFTFFFGFLLSNLAIRSASLKVERSSGNCK